MGLPGHFVVRVQTAARGLLVDPFHGGMLLTEKDCQQRLDRIFSGKVKLEPKMLRPCGQQGHDRARAPQPEGDPPARRGHRCARCAWSTCWSRSSPAAPRTCATAGVLYASLDCYALAAHDLESYLALAPRAKDAEELAARVAELKFKAARLN